MNKKRVEVLVFDGCPNIEVTLERTRAAIALANVPVDLKLVRVESDMTARSLRFLGSPTVRVDGIDVDPTANGRDDFGMQCRLYAVDGAFEHAPPSDYILAALRANR